MSCGLKFEQILFVFSVIFNVNHTQAYYTTYANSLIPQIQHETSDLPQVINIGGLFDDTDNLEEAAFKHAVEMVNADDTVLPTSTLNIQVTRLMQGDAHQASEEVCKMVGSKGGIAAMFAFGGQSLKSHTQSVCDALELPHVETTWDYGIRKDNYLINLFPFPGTLSKAFNDLVAVFNWTTYVVLYENNESLIRLEELIKNSAPNQRKAIIRQLPENGNYRRLLKDILRNPATNKIRNIFIDCSPEKLAEIFRQSQQIGLMTHEFNYIVSTLDLQMLDLEPFQHSDVNITAFRILSSDRPEVANVIQQWNNLIKKSNSFKQSHQVYNSEHYVEAVENFQMMKTETALIYDAVYLFSKALQLLENGRKVDIRSLNCDTSETWQNGYSIINYMKNIEFQGLTGLIQFDTSGFRSDIQLEVVELFPEGLTKVGIWDPKFVTNFKWSMPDQKPVPEEERMALSNRTLRITTIMNEPLCMYKISKETLYGNNQYEGYTLELVHELSKILKFKYELHIVEDGEYGGINPATGEWNGMIREVMDGKADLAIADLAVTKQREQAVDFTLPFMNLGISILFTKPKPKPPSLTSFLSPFSNEVWLLLSLSVFGVSIIVFVIARISPYEWDCPHPCITDPDELENQFTLNNSFWLTIGALMQQGSDVAPKATSTRMIAGIWGYFTLIMVSSYTANLASFLIVQELEATFKSVDELQNQTTIKYGCVHGGSTSKFFETNKKELYQNMVKMNSFVDDNLEGIERVLRESGKYAFFVESTILEYKLERKCNLTQIGGLLDSKGYGIALAKNSRYRNDFNGAVLTLQESGKLDALKRKWWKEERKAEQCSSITKSDSVKALALSNMGGIFLVLVIGCIVAAFLAIFEFCLWTRQKAKKEGDKVKKVANEELKFILQFSGTSKPITKRNEDLIMTDG